MAKTNGITVEANWSGEGTTGVEGSRDCQVTVTLGAEDCTGEVTLVPSRDSSNPDWVAYGDADHWVEGGLLSWLRARLDDEALRAALSEIEAVAAADVASVTVSGTTRLEAEIARAMREAVDAGREAGEEGGALDERALEAAAALMHAAGRTGQVSTEPTTFGVVLDPETLTLGVPVTGGHRAYALRAEADRDLARGDLSYMIAASPDLLAREARRLSVDAGNADRARAEVTRAIPRIGVPRSSWIALARERFDLAVSEAGERGLVPAVDALENLHSVVSRKTPPSPWSPDRSGRCRCGDCE